MLADPEQLVGRSGRNLLFCNNGLHIELVIDPSHPIGRDDPAHIADVVLESALSTIVDLEDSIAAVDAEDKVAAYANWLGLMQGSLSASFDKDGRTITRTLEADRRYVGADDGELVLPGRSLLFVRNVGHLMTTPAVLLADGAQAPESILDGIMTSLIAMHNLADKGVLRAAVAAMAERRHHASHSLRSDRNARTVLGDQARTAAATKTGSTSWCESVSAAT